MKKKTLVLAVMLTLVSIFGVWYWQMTHGPRYRLGAEIPNKDQAIVMVNGLTLRVEVARTTTQREKGLSGHKPLGLYEGMLFVFPQPGAYSFWMKDMLFPIDIVWLDENGKIVYIKKDAKPESYPEGFASIDPAKYVLEVNSGFSDENNLKVGDVVKISL